MADALGVAPAPGPRHQFDTVDTNVVGLGGRTFALVEVGSYPVELGETLDEQAYNPFDGTPKGSFTAHPHRDARTGENHAISYEGLDTAGSPGYAHVDIMQGESLIFSITLVPDAPFGIRYRTG